jgi:hypothetical protein
VFRRVAFTVHATHDRVGEERDHRAVRRDDRRREDDGFLQLRAETPLA